MKIFLIIVILLLAVGVKYQHMQLNELIIENDGLVIERDELFETLVDEGAFNNALNDQVKDYRDATRRANGYATMWHKKATACGMI